MGAPDQPGIMRERESADGKRNFRVGRVGLTQVGNAVPVDSLDVLSE